MREGTDYDITYIALMNLTFCIAMEHVPVFSIVPYVVHNSSQISLLIDHIYFTQELPRLQRCSNNSTAPVLLQGSEIKKRQEASTI